MALISTIAMATRGRIIPTGVRKALAAASVGWILVGGVIPPPTPPDHGGIFVGGGGRLGTYESYDEHEIRQWELRKRISKDDDEVFAIIKIWAQLNG